MAENDDVAPVEPEPTRESPQTPAPEVDKSQYVIVPEPAEPAQKPAVQPAKTTAPDVDKSQYVVTPDAQALAKASGARKVKPAKGPLKPESLSTDYIVVPEPTEAAVEPTVAAAEPAAATAATVEQPTAPPTATPTAVLPAAETEAIPVEAVPAASAPGGADASGADEPQVVYVAAPEAPKRAGNRAFGALIAVAATIIFAITFAFAVLLILRAIRGFATMSMLANFGYWIPVGVFFIAFLLVVLVVNRAGWWAHIIGSFVVGILVYVAGALLITSVSVFGLHQVATVQAALTSPTAIAAAILAREVALWAGVIVSFRGKRVLGRNREARAAFDSEQAANAS